MIRHMLRTTIAILGMAGAMLAQAQGSNECPQPLAQPTPQQLQEAASRARDRGVLWRVSKDGRTHHLYGTIHVGTLDWMFPGPKLREAMMAAQVVALEIDPTDPSVQAAVARAGNMPRPELASALVERMKQQIERACLPPALHTAHPMIQAITLSLVEAMRANLRPEFAQELALAGFARARGVPVTSLETPERQIAALMPADPASIPTLMTRMLDQLEAGQSRRYLRRLTELWERGDLDELAGYERWCECVSTSEEKAMMAAINDDRNPQIADKITELHANGKVLLVAVGALHMTGPKSLTSLLTGRGFSVERVAF
jgi:uncharacterized protein YbaP (TraB family)